jgi:GntR family transcriptional regulator
MMQRPLYRVVADRIDERIVKGIYPIGTQLPTEPVFEQEFRVSRITVRQALGLLKRRGIVASQSGIGTVVKSSSAQTKSLSFSGSIRDLIYYAAGTRYTALDRSIIASPAEIAAVFGDAGSDLVVSFRGLRGWPSGEQFGYETVYIPEALARDLDNTNLGTATLFSLLEEQHGIQIAEVEQSMTAVAAPAAIARALGAPARNPMLKATRIYRAADQRVVEVAVSFYDVARFQYVMKLFPD